MNLSSGKWEMMTRELELINFACHCPDDETLAIKLAGERQRNRSWNFSSPFHSGKTLLHVATERKFYGSVRELVEHLGSLMTTPDDRGIGAYELAVLKGNEDLASYFLSRNHDGQRLEMDFKCFKNAEPSENRDRNVCFVTSLYLQGALGPFKGVVTPKVFTVEREYDDEKDVYSNTLAVSEESGLDTSKIIEEYEALKEDRKLEAFVRNWLSYRIKTTFVYS